MSCHKINSSSRKTPQQEADTSFLGGQPRLPAETDIPNCGLCGAQQTFFFQAAFPSEYAWAGLSLAVFACTSCAHQGYFIPAMLKGPLYGADIPEGFLPSYQMNFRLLVFETTAACVRREYVEKVRFKRWELKPTSNPRSPGNKIGGDPNWILDDESPATYRSSVPMTFLLQIKRGVRFDILEGAPQQAEVHFFDLELPPKPYYNLFVSNAIYFFGTQDPSERLVYAITQR